LFLDKLIRRFKKPTLVRLYNWNSTRTEAYCSGEQFDRVFAGCNVIHDLDKHVIYSPLAVGHDFVIVFRDDDN